MEVVIGQQLPAQGYIGTMSLLDVGEVGTGCLRQGQLWPPIVKGKLGVCCSQVHPGYSLPSSGDLNPLFFSETWLRPQGTLSAIWLCSISKGSPMFALKSYHAQTSNWGAQVHPRLSSPKAPYHKAFIAIWLMNRVTTSHAENVLSRPFWYTLS